MRQKRTRKEIRNDRQDYLVGLDVSCTKDKTWWKFYHKPYSVRPPADQIKEGDTDVSEKSD